MEKQIREATNLVTGGVIGQDKKTSELTKCALEIGHIALTSLKGELRVKALNIASAIADYEDEMGQLS